MNAKHVLCLTVVAVVLRIFYLTSCVQVIENEGAEYARIAENLLTGNGYIGLQQGYQIVFPPVFPLLIAFASFFTHDSEMGGRLVSLISGGLLFIPVSLVAAKLFGRKTAVVVAWLIVLYPLLGGLSTAVLSECVYLFILWTALYFSILLIETGRLKYSLAVGLMFGVAYMTRTEALLYPFILSSVVFLAALLRQCSIKSALINTTALFTLFVLVSTPYVVYLSQQTGKFSMEGKSRINYTISKKISTGQSYLEAAYGLDEHLNESPLLNENSLNLYREKKPSLYQLLDVLKSNFQRNFSKAARLLVSLPLGSPLVLIVFILAFYRKYDDPKFKLSELFLLLLFCFHLVLFFSLHQIYLRYVFILIPFLVLWNAKGLVTIYYYLNSLASNKGGYWQKIPLITPMALSVLILMFGLYGSIRQQVFFESSSKYLPLKYAGQFLKNYPDPKQIMTKNTVIPYYAGAMFLPLPYADSSLALRYIEKKQPDFIVLSDLMESSGPYIKTWLDKGIPDKRAKLLYKNEPTDKNIVQIYQWLN